MTQVQATDSGSGEKELAIVNVHAPAIHFSCRPFTASGWAWDGTRTSSSVH